MKAKQRLLYSSELQTKLNALYKALNNAVKRLRLLSEIAKSEELVLFYQKKLKERKAFKFELREHLKANSVRIVSSGTLTGAVSRLHTKIKIVFDNDEDQVTLTKAIYHEESLLYDYQFIMRKPELLGDGLISLLVGHMECIKSDLEDMKSLK